MSVLITANLLALTAVAMLIAITVHTITGSARSRALGVHLAGLLIIETMALVVVSIVTICVWITTR